MPCGPRLATFFLYFNDVPAGGHTVFPALGVSVEPRRGRAALWYSAFPDTPDKDERTEHAAMDVERGVKWAANKWIHTYAREVAPCLFRRPACGSHARCSKDFLTPWRSGNTG